MGRIVVDVVLLPDEAMTEKAIEVNAKLVEKFGSEIVLHKENCLPHISLAMGCIDQRDISAIENILREIVDRHAIGQLRVIGVHTSTNSRGQTMSVFEVEKTNQLQSLHEKIMEKIKPYFSQEVTKEMLYDSDVAETSLEWIKNYPIKASFDRFFPHITIGYGQAEEQKVPIEFSASKLALCHLGNHCTCRKILACAELGKLQQQD